MRKAAVATSSMDDGGGSWGAGVGSIAGNMWQQLAMSLMGLEAKLDKQASATIKQYSNVDKLRAKVRVGGRMALKVGWR